MDLLKLNKICAEIVKKTRPFLVKDAQFTEKQMKLVLAHTELWWAQIEDAFGVESE